ncbi:maltokinase N-terminal cap-like domain-containing protein [Streptomyces cavernicola]|uniref:Maltokinase n=1 Tax=Streptomyces cavernicola TaxID=3043613 RepID=A0ABT6S8L5_9ACTN|nr:maltokinase [Streptomyces sp. B-S-A6]MDI3404434.1 maltokinase [Streptomyces sp. B-S-A6]
MSETVPRSGTAPARPSAGAAPRRLLDSLAPLLRDWLPRQRWFAGKGRPVTGFAPVAATELRPSSAEPGLLHLLVDARQPGRDTDCYQLLLGVRRTLPAPLSGALVGRPRGGPLAGLTVYEALHDPLLADVLLDLLRTPGDLGPLHFERPRGPAVPGSLAPRVLDVEQSNSSLVYGDAYIFKLFRRVAPGTHPELELSRALARADCPRVPTPVAWAGARPDGAAEPYVLGLLQPFVAGAADGWALALRALSEGAAFTREAAALGRATAEVHQALARALPTATLSRTRTEALAAAMTERLHSTARAVPALRPYAPALAAAYTALGALDDTRRIVQRVHGDLHLGQCLCGADGAWHVIDFEGEPARPLAERRRPHPTVRDVAGMLRSFEYAACTHRAPAWAAACRDAYCDGYAEAAGHDPRAERVLLRAYETDKAVYEVLYEARHRPDWLPVPMSAIRRLAAPR